MTYGDSKLGFEQDAPHGVSLSDTKLGQIRGTGNGGQGFCRGCTTDTRRSRSKKRAHMSGTQANLLVRIVWKTTNEPNKSCRMSRKRNDRTIGKSDSPNYRLKVGHWLGC